MALGSEAAARIHIERRIEQQNAHDEATLLRKHLLRTPPQVPARYFYDDRGSALFEQITTTREYYQTRTERALLESIADDVISRTSAVELVELGSGASSKTRILLDAMHRANQLRVYVPYDVNESMVERVAEELSERYPQLQVDGVVADFVLDVGLIPGVSPRLIIFLGGTIGNFEPDEAAGFLGRVASHMDEGDYLLLGTDLVKDRRRLEAAYNDDQGLTAQFNKNLLTVLNRNFQADFDPATFDHRAIYNDALNRIEMHLVARRDQLVSIDALDLKLGIAAHHHILTEISVKYDRQRVTALLESNGYRVENFYTDPDRLFALTLAARG